MTVLLQGAALGIAATAVMDLWNLLLRRTAGIASLNYCHLGRWVMHLPTGRVVHRPIADSPPRPAECAVGWLAHGSIGAVLGTTFLLLHPGWAAHPTALPAIGFGVATVVLPFAILQPALGLGLAARRARAPWRARAKSVTTHLVFGTGLWLAAMIAAGW